jgi:hypothetical protein
MAAAVDKPSATHRSGVTTQWGDANQFGSLATRETAQLRQIREQRPREDRADPRDTLEQIILLAPRRTRADHLSEIAVGDPELAFEKRCVPSSSS